MGNMEIILGFLTALVLCCLAVAENASCPAIYQRLADNHSFCLPPGPSCQFLSKGLHDNETEISEIIDAHNYFRSIVAMGEEEMAGGMPEASNMMEMSWDPELAAVAQKWAERCVYEHDCNDCRGTRSFPVGQNLGLIMVRCKGNKCRDKDPYWTTTVQMFYDEVLNFDKNLIDKLGMPSEEEPVTGHFTQVIWANTYKVGCGYSSYVDDGFYKQLYVCNYGPRGNHPFESVYKRGPPCSACPANSCCGENCPGEEDIYPGLCRLTEGEAPVYIPKQNPLFLCDFAKEDPNCSYKVDEGEWNIIKTSGGSFLSVSTAENGSSAVHFDQSVKLKMGSCMILTMKRGPEKFGDLDQSFTEVTFHQNGQAYNDAFFTYAWPEFYDTSTGVELEGDFTFSIKFSVPLGTPPQYLEIKRIEFTEEACKDEE